MARLFVEVTSKGIQKVKGQLEGLTKAAKNTEVSAENVKSAISAVGKTAIATTGAVAAFTSVMTANTNELKRNATAAGLSIKEFQDMALAVGTVGVSSEQLGSILGDTEEKIGDFLATGGGAFQDFADVMGLTAEEARGVAEDLQGLSGRDVLVEITRQMEAAGASAEEMNFALEGMASDSRYLLPLLKSNGEELSALEGRFGNLATTITDDTNASLNELNTVATLVAKNMSNTLATALASVSTYLVAAGENAAFFWASLQSGTQQEALSNMATLSKQMQVINREISDLEEGGTLVNKILSDEGVASQIEKRRATLAKLTAEYEAYKQQYLSVAGLTTPTGGASEPLELTISGGSSSVSGDVSAEIAALQNRFVTEFELLEQRKALVLESSLNEQEQMALIDQLQNEYFDNAISRAEQQASVEQAAAAATARAEEQQLRNRSQAMGDFTSDLQASLGEQNALYKAVATTNATIKTYEAANSAYAAMASIPYVGPALGAAAAGAAVAAGLANVAAINSARMQGGQVTAGVPYQVGERGVETFIPNQSGTIAANGAGESTGMTVNVYNQTGSSVQAVENESGGTDIYITRDEFQDGLTAAAQNPNSGLNQGLQSTYKMERN